MDGSAEEVFRNLNRRLDGIKHRVEAQRASQVAELLDNYDPDVEAESRGSKVQVRFKDSDSEGDIIDLKEGFKRGKSARRTADGGWYTIVPIRLYTGSNRRKSSSGMSKRLYEQLRQVNLEKNTSRTVVTDYLYDNRRGYSGLVSELNYKPRSKNITKIEDDAKVRRRKSHQYVAFRTVSDKSHPASWILNKGSASRRNPSSEVRRVIREVKRYNQIRNRY